MSLWKWSQTAATNATADSTINFAEGQSPGSVNDSARALMAAVAKWRDDISGNLVTGGTSTAYTLTSSQNLTTLTDGFQIAFRPHAVNGASATLQVDLTAAKALRVTNGTALPAGTFGIDSTHRATYDSGDDCYYVHAYWDIAALVAAAVAEAAPVGSLHDYVGSTAPSGFVMASGLTIGDGTSLATERANDDTEALFTLLWTTYDNTALPVSGGRGASAAADYAAHKTITLPDLRGRGRIGKDDMGGSAANRVTSGGSGIAGATLGATGGAQTHTLTEAQMPEHDHGVNDPTHHHSLTTKSPTSAQGGTGGFGLWYSTASDNTGDSATGITIQNAGSGAAHNNMPPVFVANVLIKL